MKHHNRLRSFFTWQIQSIVAELRANRWATVVDVIAADQAIAEVIRRDAMALQALFARE